jgi:tRNA G10  N-methylase Trm11
MKQLKNENQGKMMNERAIEFALEVLKDQPTLQTWTFTRSELEQYAELIVRDCAEIVKDVHKSGGDTYSDILHERYNIKYFWQK